MKTIKYQGVEINISDKQWEKIQKSKGTKSTKAKSKTKTISTELHVDEERTKTTWEKQVLLGINGHEDRVLQISDVCVVYHTPNTNIYRLYIIIPTWMKWTIRKGKRAGEKFSPFQACKNSAYHLGARWSGNIEKGYYMWDFPSKEAAEKFVAEGFHC